MRILAATAGLILASALTAGTTLANEAKPFLGYKAFRVIPDGIRPVYGERIEGLIPGFPAWDSGLKCGDILFGFKTSRNQNAYYDMDVLPDVAVPGSPVILLVMRNATGFHGFFELEIIPVERPVAAYRLHGTCRTPGEGR